MQWYCMLILSHYSHCMLDLQCASEPLDMSDEMAKPTTLTHHTFLPVRKFLSVLPALAQYVCLVQKHRKEQLNLEQNTVSITKWGKRWSGKHTI